MNYFFETRTVNNTKMKKNTRPTCSVPGCNNLAIQIVAKSHPNYPRYRRSNWIKKLHPETDDIWCCGKCHGKNTARNHGVSSAEELTARRAGFDSVTKWRHSNQEQTARRAGFDSVIKWRHSKHPYLWARKDYCENIDGRLGFKCTTNIFWEGMLDVDHIDGNSDNNLEDESNFQTLCKCCHSYKSWKNADYATIGRKKLKELKNITEELV